MGLLVALLLAAPLTLRYDDTDVGEIVREVATQAETKIVLDDAFLGKRISLDVDEWQLVEVLEEIAKRVGGQVYRVPNGPFRIVPEWQHPFLKRLHETRVSLRTDDATPIASILQTFRELTGVPVVLDPGRTEWPDLELTADKVTGVQLLDLVAAPHELVWELRYGVVFVSKRARMEKLPARLELTGIPDTLVRLSFDDASLPEAAKLLALMGGIEIGGELPQEPAVTLHVPSLELHHALELLFLPHGLDVRTEGGKVVVSRAIPPTPFPPDFPQLRAEAQAIDRARKLGSNQELDAVSEKAIARLDEAYSLKYDAPEGPWCLLYLAEWNALRGARIDKQETAIALDYLKTIEEALDGADHPSRRPILEAARAARKRIEAAAGR